MIDERENIFDETKIGSLTARRYDISGNDIDAFYDASGDLVFVIDNTINSNKPNVLLVINPVADKKWDEILSGQYGVDLENIRPKQDNKYQKLDIEYSGLGVYENLIKAFVNGDSLDESLAQLDILRDSAARHSAMIRLNAANEIISKTNATMVKTRESIVRLQERLKTLRARLTEQKKIIGRVSTKQSAAKILKLESMIEATNEKIKRAEKRLESAQKRLEIATVDAELATELLNQPNREKHMENKNKPLAVAPKYPMQTTEPDSEPDDDESEILLPEPEIDGEKEMIEDTDKDVPENSEIKPLLDKDPEIINEDIAFKPISFDVPPLMVPVDDANATTKDITVVEENSQTVQSEPDTDVPVLIDEKLEDAETTEPAVEPETDLDDKPELLDSDFNTDQRPVLESITPVSFDEKTILAENGDVVEEDSFDAPVLGDNQPTQEIQVPETKLDDVVDTKVPENKVEFVNNESDDKENVSESEQNTEIPRAENLIRPLPPASTVANAPAAKPVIEYDTHSATPGTSKPSFVYYILLLFLIGLSVLTLWLYQKNMGNGTPVFDDTPFVETTNNENKVSQKPVVSENVDVFVDTKNNRPTQTTTNTNMQSVVVVEPEPQELAEPTIMNSVSDNVMSFSGFHSEPEPVAPVKQEVVVNKPVYDAGSKYEEMFVYEEDQVPTEYVEEYDEYEPGDAVYYEEVVVNDGEIVYEYVDEDYDETESGVQEQASEPQQDAVATEPQRIVYNGDEIYADDNDYEEGFDEEEAAYQAGYDGYDVY